MKKIFSILLLLLTICFMTSHAQQMPITVTPILTPPYTPSLSKMCESGSTSLMVNVFVNDVTASDIQLRLHLKLESTGITIESVSKAPVRPISVGGGEARVLMGSDLADVLSLNNLTFKGYDKAAYIKTGALPGGVWRLTAWLEHYHTGRILSNKGTAMAVIASYPPPVLTSPKNNEVTTGDMSKPIVFTWNASKFMGGTASLLYTLEMWEMHTDGVPAEAVVASQSPIYTSAPTAGLSHTLIPTSLAMEPGRKYCWRVTVSDPSGKAHIQNGGRSEVRVFQYLEKCPDICEINVTVRDVTATATWDVDTRHKGGWNVEMYDDAGTYHETLWTGNNNTGEQIFDYGTKWHVRVQGVCQGGQVSAWSEWKDFQIAERFTTPKRDDGTPYECGEFAEPRVITNMEEKELKKGDIIENERGTTKYEIYSATRNDDGSYRGLSYIILSIWNCKVLGEYDNLRVNTDGVNISNFSWRSKKSDLLMADPDAIRQWTEELAKDIAGATYNNTIKETIKLDDVSFETIVRKDGKYYAVVKTETGEIEEVDITYSVDGKKRVAIEGKDGKQLVVDKNGEMMGVEEYKYCGGSKLLLNENMKEKDAKVARSGNVYFSQYGDTYLFDDFNKYKKHSAAEGYAKRFPRIGEGTYRPAYACTESNSEIQLKAEQYKTYTFKNERGVPVVCKDGILAVTARGDRDTTSIYAYDYDGQVVGKVNVMSYDKVTRKVCLVPVGIEKSEIKASEIKQGLDDKFAKLMVDFEVTVADRIDITYAKGDKFVHGGSGMIGVYNDDQKSAISKLKETIAIDDETCYLFMVKNCIAKKADDSNDIVSGYMPRGYQFGFIYNELTNSRTIAHELSHGAFHLKHTFAAGEDYIAPERSTDNLMDYAGGETLNHWQWQDVHLPKSVRFKWLQDEEGAEANLLPFIYWLGHGDIGKYFSDELEDKVDDFLDIFKVGYVKRSEWINGRDNTIDKYRKEWSVEKSDIVPKIWLSIKNNESTDVNLKANKVYSWAGNVVTSSKEPQEIGSEENARFIYVNLFSFVDNAKLSDYKINSLSDLKDNKRVKAGYYDWNEKFFVIAFFSDEGSLDFVLQIPTIDSDVSLLAEDWVSSLLMSRNEPCDETEKKDPIQYALEVISGYEGKTYHQDSGELRTGMDEAALAQMDCSELVCRFLQLACGLDNVPSMTTIGFKSIVDGEISSEYVEYVEYVDGSKLDRHTEIKPGDIFLWRNSKGGHVGVVKEYNSSNDVLMIIEAIGSSGSAEDSSMNSSACKGCIRESQYTRLGNALMGHDGWQGYLRPIINTK